MHRGRLSRTFLYINSSTEAPFPEQELIAFDKAGHTVVLNRVAIDRVPPYVAAAERPELAGILRRAVPGDSLVVLEIAALGCSARDALSTLMQCRSKRSSSNASKSATSISRAAPNRRRSRCSGR